jgi:hypothetical protein
MNRHVLALLQTETLKQVERKRPAARSGHPFVLEVPYQQDYHCPKGHACRYVLVIRRSQGTIALRLLGSAISNECMEILVVPTSIQTTRRPEKLPAPTSTSTTNVTT